ncbi:MAG: hypothetical protein D6677_04375 [Calditrichaeota bacterium]|nr:MAG: hypothetical protein D6677_04375 [Calditrichota bacterium]
MNKMKTFWITGLITLQLVCGQTFDAAGLGFADTYLTGSRGLDAFSRNPANLAYETPTTVALRLPVLNVNVSNSGISFADYERYFTRSGNGGEWTTEDKEAIIDLIPEDGLDINILAGLAPFSVRINSLAFGAALVEEGNITLNTRKLVEYAFRELNFNQDFRFQADALTEWAFFAAVKISAAYGHLLDFKYRKWDLDEIAVGLRYNQFLGIAAVQVQEASVDIKRQSNGENFDDEFLTTRGHVRVNVATPEDGVAGLGYGIDLAASARWKMVWRFSLALENGVGSITWDNNPRQQNFVFQDTLFFNGDSAKNSINEDTLQSISSFRTPLPVSLVAGASWRFNSALLFMAQWRQYLTRDLGTPLTPEVGVAVAYTPVDLVTLRSGMRMGGKDTFVFALGAGFHFGPLQLDMGYAMRQALWPTLSNGVLFSFGMTFGF